MGLWLMNIGQAADATKPGRVYRAAFLNAVCEIGIRQPPRIVVESWMTGFFRMRLASLSPRTQITSLYAVGGHARDYEAWIRQNEASWEPGTLLVTGLGSYVHYGCQSCGPRLHLFSQPLSSRWILARDVGCLDYLPYLEDAQIWMLQPPPPTLVNLR